MKLSVSLLNILNEYIEIIEKALSRTLLKFNSTTGAAMYQRIRGFCSIIIAEL